MRVQLAGDLGVRTGARWCLYGRRLRVAAFAWAGEIESGVASETPDFFGRKARANSACLPPSANATVGVD
jgi:hypothetical protein